MLLLLISFVAGILTILAPCVLPLLPVIVGGSVGSADSSRERARPYLIAASLAGAIILFTLLLKVSTVLVNIPPNLLTDISGGLVVLLGLAAVAPELWEKLMIQLNWQAASQRFLGRGERSSSRYLGPILIGLALGPVFASCSPTYAFILASVLPHSLLSGLFYLVAYSLGLVLTLLVLSLAGRKYIARFPWAVNTHSLFRRCIGILFVVIGVLIIGGQEVRLETWVANHLPFDETKIERVLLATQHHSTLVHTLHLKLGSQGVLNVQPAPAPEFVGLANWINSPPLQMSKLRGKVVLVDFWTYSCINCIRSLPYVEKWYQTYQSKGLVVVGVSTPEFAFEHNPANVAAAVKRDGIKYPVALDNNDDTWNAYQNDSWPADYLIDKSGNIRYVSLGEGDYGTTEQAIQQLLGVKAPLQTPTSNVPISQTQTPETYFGTNREDNFVGSPQIQNGTNHFTPAANLQPDEWTLGGSWNVVGQYITSEDQNATLSFNVTAKDTYVVAGNTPNASSSMKVNLPSAQAGDFGADAPGGIATVNGSKLYHIVSLPQLGTTTVTLHVPKGVSLYTFTFGS